MHDSHHLYCAVRRRFLERTPEEEVRQGLIKWLHTVKGCPLGLMACEYPMRAGELRYRADLLLFDRTARPLLLAECKAPTVALDGNVFEQILRYNSLLHVPFLLLCNGQGIYFCRRHPDGTHQFRAEIPLYQDLQNEISDDPRLT